VSVAADPVTVLIKIAAAHHADGIVLGASKAIGHKLFGSAAPTRSPPIAAGPVTVVALAPTGPDAVKRSTLRQEGPVRSTECHDLWAAATNMAAALTANRRCRAPRSET